MRIGIFGNNYQTKKQKFIKLFFEHLLKLGAKIWIDRPFYNYLFKYFAFVPKAEGFISKKPLSLDIVFSIGGDGTFLRTANWVGHRNIPILGINTGHLGFLADISTIEIIEVLNEIFQSKYSVEERSLLQIEFASQYCYMKNYALNEIAILKRDTSSMISISTYLNELFLTKYLADGLLLATPSGSTAYNLSVNGPIIVPQAHNFVLSPVAPHSLNVRPLVIPEDYKMRFIVKSRSKNFLVSLDGRSRIFPSGSIFKAQKANFTIKIAKRLNHNFYDTLREKLSWGGDTSKYKMIN
ncbi:MAG: NAD kinase [Bacteroidales bacterium OttesenSCG-928-I14]|jgi:NAD+ kinase|nr:NAD kinase [Bacteroidales bacterium OttesenSCG-928-I14]